MTSTISSSSRIPPSRYKPWLVPEKEQKYFNILRANSENLKGLLKNCKLKKFVTKLCHLGIDVHKLSLITILEAIEFEYKNEKAFLSLLKNFFSPNSDGVSKAFLTLLDAKNTPEQDNQLVCFTYKLCKEFNVFYPQNPDKEPLLPYNEEKDNLDYCLSACENDSLPKAHKVYYKQRTQTHIILNWINTFYIVERDTDEVRRKNDEVILSILDESQNKLKGTLSATKGVHALNSQQSWSKDNFALGVVYNASTDTGPFSNAFANASTEGSMASYNSGVLAFAALLGALWRGGARDPKEADKRERTVRIKSLYKFSKVVSNRLSPAFLSRIERHHENLNRGRLFTLVAKFRRRFCVSEKTKINIKQGLPYTTQKNLQLNSNGKLYETHFDRATEFKTAFYTFKTDLSNNLKTNSSITEIVDKFIKTMQNFPSKLGEKFNQLNFKQSRFRGTLLQHLLNLYKIYPAAQTEVKRIIEALGLIPANKKSISDIFKENKKVIANTDWKLRSQACLGSQEILSNILGSHLAKSEQKILIHSILELLQAKDKGPMAALRERREKHHTDASSALALQGWNLKRVVPLAAASSLTVSADTAALGWGINAAFIPLANYFSTCDTDTFKSMENSLQGALTYLESNEDTNENSCTLENAIKSIHDLLNEKENKKKITDDSAEIILSTLTALKTAKGNSSLCLALEHKHGRKESKFPLLFELMDKLPQNYVGKLFKIYFTKEDLNLALSKPENSDYNYDLFNRFLSQEIKLAKSPREAALVTIKGMAYLHNFHETIENKEKALELKENEDLKQELKTKLSEQKHVYKACRQKFETTIQNTYDNKHSEFRILNKQSRGSRFRSEFAIRAAGSSLWGLMAASLASTILGATSLGIGVGIGISMTGIGLPLGLPLLLLFSAVRMVLYAFSDDPDRQYSRRTNTYKRVKDQSTRLPKLKDFAFSNKKSFAEKLEEKNLETIHQFDQKTFPSANEPSSSIIDIHDEPHLFGISRLFSIKESLLPIKEVRDENPHLSHFLTKQTEFLFGFDVDKENIESMNAPASNLSPFERYQVIKKELLLQNYDKSSLLEVLFRIVRLVVVCDIEPKVKIRELESLFKDIQAGRNGNSSALFAKLSLENSYTRTKNWYVFHALLGMGTAAGTISSLFFAMDPAEAFAQFALTTAGDVVCGQSQNQTFYSPHGNTTSFQQASLLIKNMLIALSIVHDEKLSEESKKILAQKTARINAGRFTKSDSTKLYEKHRAVPVFKMA